MPFERVEKPIPGAEAFEQTSDAALLSQAAILLTIGAQMRPKLARIAEAELAMLGVPRVAAQFETREAFIDPTDVRGLMVRKLGARSFPADILAPVHGRATAEIFRILTEEPSALWTAGLLEASLRHSKELVRVAAAGAYQGFTTEKDRIIKILLQGTYSDEQLVRDLAATALAQADPDHARLTGLESKARAAGTGEASHTTLLVHGTFARQSTWWQPGGDFHTYLTGLLPTLPRVPPWDAPYGAQDRFDWTGGYSDELRSDAADQLLKWVGEHGAQGLDLITHSYGGNVAMLATNGGLDVGELVLLSCPALPATYFPDFARVHGKVVSFRVHMDVVLLLDSFVSGALSEFTDPRIEEHTLALWFDHSATHNPDTWNNPNHDIPGKL